MRSGCSAELNYAPAGLLLRSGGKQVAAQTPPQQALTKAGQKNNMSRKYFIIG